MRGPIDLHRDGADDVAVAVHSPRGGTVAAPDRRGALGGSKWSQWSGPSSGAQRSDATTTSTIAPDGTREPARGLVRMTVPADGGHRVLGRAKAPNAHRGNGYDHLEVIADDASRAACVVLVADESGADAAHALETAAVFFAERGIRIERVLTDTAKAYATSRLYAATLAELGIRHKRTRMYRPQTNGKAERFIRTLLDEWAYARPYRSNAEWLRALPRWVRFDCLASVVHRPRRR